MADMKFYCSHCTQSMEGPEDMVGQLIDCPGCGKSIELCRQKNNQPQATQLNTAGEFTEYESHPAMFRSRPVLYCLILLMMFFGIPLAVIGQGELAMDLLPANLFGFLMGGLILSLWKVGTLCRKLTITNKRSIGRHGLLSKRTSEVLHRDIRNVIVDQGVFQRIFKTGTVAIASAGHGGMEIVAHGMPYPNRIKSIIDSHRE